MHTESLIAGAEEAADVSSHSASRPPPTHTTTSSTIITPQTCNTVSSVLIGTVLGCTLFFIVIGIIMITTGCLIVRDKHHDKSGYLALVIIGSLFLGVNAIVLMSYSPVLAATRTVCNDVLVK
jgi:hypothetical protein